jgi:CHAT domain-containing protein
MTRAYSEFWQGASLDRNKLALALPSLLDTADELEAVAAKLGASHSDIHLQKDASETTVKRAPLADYRVVYFATHGLLASDVKGLGEPSLALTIPNAPSELDDGLLTASEVAQLKLNADWVVLSATAAGDKPGAEALSGLARAFFCAGAHALLVSHWAVESDAAKLNADWVVLSACNTIAGDKPGAEALSGLARAFFYAGTRALLVSHWAAESNAAMRLVRGHLRRARSSRRCRSSVFWKIRDPRWSVPSMRG